MFIPWTKLLAANRVKLSLKTMITIIILKFLPLPFRSPCFLFPKRAFPIPSQKVFIVDRPFALAAHKHPQTDTKVCTYRVICDLVVKSRDRMDRRTSKQPRYWKGKTQNRVSNTFMISMLKTTLRFPSLTHQSCIFLKPDKEAHVAQVKYPVNTLINRASWKVTNTKLTIF